MNPLSLIVMLGLPGSGKSTIADGVGRELSIPVVSIDPIEVALWRGGLVPEQTGIAAYLVAEAIAAANLSNGVSVIIDAVCPVEASRELWRRLAKRTNATLKWLYVVCDDEGLHRARIEQRVRKIEGMPETRWERVLERRAEFEPVTDACLTLQTAAHPPSALIQQSLDYIRAG